MKNVKMYEVGEEVYIKAKITEILVDNGEIKYHIKAEHSNNDLGHNYTEHQLFQIKGLTGRSIDTIGDIADDAQKELLGDPSRKKYSSSNRK